MPRLLRPFGFKDLFTLVNFVSGVVAVGYVLNDDPRRAGYAVIFGYLFGDLLDGFVARLTKTSNLFGAEFDSIVDHFVHVVVPALIIYTVYDDAGYHRLGLIALGVLIGTATLRHARLATSRFDFPLCWNGLPRTISGFTAMALPLSRTFTEHIRAQHLWGFAAVLVLSALNLVPIPYMTHRGKRGMQPWVKMFVGAFIISTMATFVFAREWTFDVFAAAMLTYALGGWIPVMPEERDAFYTEYHRWSESLER